MVLALKAKPLPQSVTDIAPRNEHVSFSPESGNSAAGLASPLSLPNAGNRFMSLIVIDQDQYTPAVYYGGSHSFDRQQIGKRYLMLALRTFAISPAPPEPASAKPIARKY